MGVLEITAIVMAVAAVGSLAAAIFLRRDSHRASDGGVVAPDNKGTINTKRDTITTDQATTVERAGDVHIEHHGLAGDDHDRLVRMEDSAKRTEEATKQILDEIARGTAAPGTFPPDTAELAAQATEAIEKKLEEALELFHAGEYRDAIEHVLTAYDRELPAGARAQLHLVAGNAYFLLSDYGAAESHFRDVMQAAHDSGDREAEAAALGNLGLVRAERGDLEGAEEHVRKALEIEEETADRSGQATLLGNLGVVYKRRGDVDGAEEYHRRALEIDEEIGNRLGQAQSLGNLGLVQAERGDFDGAEEYHRKALAIDEEIGYRLGHAQDLGNLGEVYFRRGDLDGAEEHCRNAIKINEEIGNRLGQARQFANLGLVQAERGDLEGAEERYTKALEIAEEIGAEPLVTQVQGLLENLKETDG